MTARFLSIVGAVRGRRPRLQEILMRRWIQVCAIVLTVTAGFALPQAPGTGGRSIQGRSPAPPAPGPLVNLVQPGVDAYNKADIGYFEKAFADDILWVGRRRARVDQ